LPALKYCGYKPFKRVGFLMKSKTRTNVQDQFNLFVDTKGLLRYHAMMDKLIYQTFQSLANSLFFCHQTNILF